MASDVRTYEIQPTENLSSRVSELLSFAPPDLGKFHDQAAGLGNIAKVLGLEPSFNWTDLETRPKPTIDFDIPPAGAGPLKQTMQTLGGGLYGTAADVSGGVMKMLGMEPRVTGALLPQAVDYWSEPVESPYHAVGEEPRGWKIAKDIAALPAIAEMGVGVWNALKLRDAQVTFHAFEREFDAGLKKAFPKIQSSLTNAKQTAVLDDLKAVMFNRYLQKEAASYPRTTLYGGLPVKWKGGLTEVSGIEKALKSVSQPIWQVPQLLGFLKGKVSQDEIQHLLMPILEGKDTVTTSDILTQIPIRIPQVEEVVKRVKPVWSEDFIKMHQEEFSKLEGRQLSRQETIDQMNRQASEGWADTEDIVKAQGQPRFATYQIPGGENYREVLIKAPTVSGNASRDSYFKSSEGDVSSAVNFKSSHWDEPNVLAHLRMNDRTTPDGKKVLFIEELQSDWAKELRRLGPAGDFEAASKAAQDYLETLYQKYGSRNRAHILDGTAEGLEVEKYYALNEAANKAGKGVPSHPLLKNWQELALKRVLKEAVDGGYDYVSWTTGEQQIKRYPGLKAGEDVEKVRRGETWAHNLYEKQTPNILKNLTKGEISTVKIKGNDMSPEIAKIALKQGRELYWQHHEGFDGYVPINNVADLNEAVDEGISIFERKFKVKRTITIPADRTSKEKGKPAWFVVDEAGKPVDIKYSQDEAYDKAHELNASSGELTQPALKITPEIKARFK